MNLKKLINYINKIETKNCSLFTEISDLNNGEIYLDILILIIKKINPINSKSILKELKIERLYLDNIYNYKKNIINLNIFIKYIKIIIINDKYIEKWNANKILDDDKNKIKLLKFLISVLNNEYKFIIKKDIKRICNKKGENFLLINNKINKFSFDDNKIKKIVDWLKSLRIIPKNLINYNYIYLDNKDGKIFFELFNYLENDNILKGYISSKGKPNFNILINYQKIINFLIKLDDFDDSYKDIDYFSNLINNKCLFWDFLDQIKIYYQKRKNKNNNKKLNLMNEKLYLTLSSNFLNNKEEKIIKELNNIDINLKKVKNKSHIEYLNNNIYLKKNKIKKHDDVFYFIKNNKYVNFLYSDDNEVKFLDKLEFEFIEFVKHLKLQNYLTTYQEDDIFENNLKNGFLLNKILNKIFNISIKNVCKKPIKMEDIYLNFNKSFNIIREKSEYIYEKYKNEVKYIIKGNLHLLYLLIKDLMEYVSYTKNSKIKFKVKTENIYFKNKYDKFFYKIKLFDKYNSKNLLHNIHFKGQTGELFLDVIKNGFGYLLLGCHYNPQNNINYQYNILRILEFFKNLNLFESEYLWKNDQFLKGNHKIIMRFLSEIIDYFYCIYFKIYKNHEFDIFKNQTKNKYKFVGFIFDIEDLKKKNNINEVQNEKMSDDDNIDLKKEENEEQADKKQNGNFLKNLLENIFKNAIQKKSVPNKWMMKFFKASKIDQNNLNENDIKIIKNKMKKFETKEYDEKNYDENLTKIDFSKYTKKLINNIINIWNFKKK